MRFVSRVASLVLTAALTSQSKLEPSSLPDSPQSLYYVILARGDAKPPDTGRGLLVVLPGGDGSREFIDWVETIATQAPDDSITVFVTAPKWDAGQEIVWPLASSKVGAAKYTTEAYVAAVVEAVRK